jgi:hypothetical protein
MITEVYLVDCENVGGQSLCINNIQSQIFYLHSTEYKAQNRLPNETNVLYEHPVDKNALDFVLDSYLGYQIARYGLEAKYIIVSNDKGFDHLINFWSSYGYKVERLSREDIVSNTSTLPNIKNTLKQMKAEQSKLKEEQSEKSDTVSNQLVTQQSPSKSKDSKALKEVTRDMLFRTIVEKKKAKVTKKQLSKILDEIIDNQCENKKQIQSATKSILKTYNISDSDKKIVVEVSCSRLEDLRKLYQL